MCRWRRSGPQRRIGRLSEIGRVATRHGFGYLIDRRRSNDDKQLADRGRRLREMLDELGPTFVKFGQLLSTRPDVMPPDIIAELRKLQDDVTPFPFADVRRVIEEELGLTIEQAFLDVRRDADRGGVDRPGAPRHPADRRRGRRQGAAARGAAADRVRPPADALGGEASSASASARSTSSTPRRSWTSSPARSGRSSTTSTRPATPRRSGATSPAPTEVAVPQVIWRYSSPRVLTLELPRTAASSPTSTLETRSPEQRRELAYRMTDAWMTMIFRHGFFHGDPHPANILLLDDGRIGLVDFGLAGQADRRGHDAADAALRRRRDRERRRAPATPRGARPALPEGAGGGARGPRSRSSSTATTARASPSIDPIEVIREGLDLIYSLNLRLPTRFVILDKAIATLGAVGVELYPDFNVFEVAKPYARGLLAERFSPRRMSLRAPERGARARRDRARAALPAARRASSRRAQGRFEVQIRNPGFDDLDVPHRPRRQPARGGTDRARRPRRLVDPRRPLDRMGRT